MSIYNNYRRSGVFPKKKLSNSEYEFKISKEYDEPTFLSFHLEFAPKSDMLKFNYSGGVTSFDFMPHPLFQYPLVGQNVYSAISYLENINEPVRARMLKSFIDMMYDIQDNFQWTFEEISGLDSILKVNPTNGMRIAKDAKLVVTCFDTIDRKIQHMFNLYRKVVWDDQYQRWILPKMMRNFTLNVYVTEYREFHKPYDKDGNLLINSHTDAGSNGYTKNIFKSIGKDVKKIATDFIEPVVSGRGVIPTDSALKPVFMRKIYDMLPVHLIKLEMCEIDINSFEETTMPNLKVTDLPSNSKFKFTVKPGNAKEFIHNPIFNESYIADELLNDISRTHIRTSEKDDQLVLSNTGQSISDISRKAYGVSGVDPKYDVHRLDKSINSEGIDNYVGDSYTKNWINKNLKDKVGGKVGALINNAVDYGSAVVNNGIKDLANQALNKELYNGLSINEIRDVLGSNDVMQIIDAVRGGAQNYSKMFLPAPSSMLNPTTADQITVNALKDYVQSVVSDNERTFQNEIRNAVTYIDHLGSIDAYKSHIETLKEQSAKIDYSGNDERCVSKATHCNPVAFEIYK